MARFLTTAVSPVVADLNIEISGNGTDTNNQIDISSSQNIEVNQTNVGNINNSTQTAQNTGGNSASGNSSDVQISTGNTQTSIQIENSLNQNQTNINNCCGEVNLNINDNGSQSSNQINVSSPQTQTANISNYGGTTNQTTIGANTGKNISSQNSAQVSIKTGHVIVTSNIQNRSNQNSINLAEPFLNTISSVRGNGPQSTNSITADWQASSLISISNSSRTNNTQKFNLNTGGNEASNDTNPIIDTGDILLNLNLANQTNLNDIIISCCPVRPTPTPTLLPTPTPIPTGGPPSCDPADPADPDCPATTQTPPDQQSKGPDGTSTQASLAQVLGLSATGSQLSFISQTLYAIGLLFILKSSKIWGQKEAKTIRPRGRSAYTLAQKKRNLK